MELVNMLFRGSGDGSFVYEKTLSCRQGFVSMPVLSFYFTLFHFSKVDLDF